MSEHTDYEIVSVGESGRYMHIVVTANARTLCGREHKDEEPRPMTAHWEPGSGMSDGLWCIDCKWKWEEATRYG